MTVRIQQRTFEAVQFSGRNKTECDTFAGKKSILERGGLVYPDLTSQKLIVPKGDWLILKDGNFEALSDTDFQRQFEVIV